MTTKEDEILRRFEHVEDLPIDDADYDKEFPILSNDQPSTCRKCGAGYVDAQYMALDLPDAGKSIWTYESLSANVSFAVRKCACGNMLGRRSA